MNPHKLVLHLFLCLIFIFLCAKICVCKPPTGGRLAIVVDERLAALRREPQLNARLVKRLSRGRLVAIRVSRTSREGVVFFLVNVTSRTHGWIQREAVVTAGRTGDDRFLLDLIKASHGFDRIARARIFLDHFPRSPLRPQVLLLLSNAAEEQAAKLSRDAAKRLQGTGGRPETIGAAPEFTYFLNYSGLDRYNRQRVTFIFHQPTKRFHYDGAAWRELVRRYPKTPEATEARQRLAQLAELKP
ncbi:MAG TPA: hypothetical protein VK893_05290 [Pyrinomonadaceae bacterium]|nr:hypothetical protein [Pyrinomonadaceae bacterium]